MHDPSFLALEVRPVRLDVWHDEPGGADAFTVCGRPPQGGVARLRWTIRHGRHLHYRFWPYLKVRRWVKDRCEGCGRRFLWRDARFSYQGTDKVWHDPCMSLRHLRSQLDDITGYLRGTADANARWRVEYRLRGLDEPGATATGSSSSGDAR
jgi:hypothetical protein